MDKEVLIQYCELMEEIKDIRKYLNKNGRINSNLDLMKVLSEKNYRKYKSIIKYDKF